MTTKGSVIIGDNSLLFGSLVDKPKIKTSKEAITAMKKFNARLADNNFYESILLPTSEGMTIAVKKMTLGKLTYPPKENNPSTASAPNHITSAATTMPIIPISMPRIMTIPSRLSNPREMTKMPIPGIKLVIGSGMAMVMAKINQKKPMIFSPHSLLANDNLGFRNFSIFFNRGEAFETRRLGFCVQFFDC